MVICVEFLPDVARQHFFKNRPMFHGVIQKIIVARVYGPRCRPHKDQV